MRINLHSRVNLGTRTTDTQKEMKMTEEKIYMISDDGLKVSKNFSAAQK